MTGNSSQDAWYIALSIIFMVAGLLFSVFGVVVILIWKGRIADLGAKKMVIIGSILFTVMYVSVGGAVYMVFTGAPSPLGALPVLLLIGLILGVLSGTHLYGMHFLRMNAYSIAEKLIKPKKTDLNE